MQNVVRVLYSIKDDTQAETDAYIHFNNNDDVSPSGSNIPYSNGVVKGAGDKLISHCVKAQREDLCSVTLVK